MKIRLGEMSIGDIFTNSFGLLFNQLGKFVVIYSITGFPWLVLSLLQFQDVLVKIGLVGIIILYGTCLLLGLAMMPFALGAVLKVVVNSYLGEPITVSDAFRFVLKKFWKLIGTMLLVGLVVGVGYIFCIIPGILFTIYYCFSAQVVVAENLSGGRALGRSKSLTKGYRWRFVGIWILLIVIYMLLASINVTLSFGLNYLFSGTLLQPSYIAHIITSIINFFVNNIVQGAFGTIVITLLYFDIRTRKEGFDLVYLSSKSEPVKT